jgi:acetylornithine/succinyldiaminopimelate/putrescine aminotransferase
MDTIASILRGGFEDFREFINPMIYNRAELAREPIRAVRAEGGKLVLDDGTTVEDFHGTQAFGHRHPRITAAVREYLESDAPNWFPSRVNPFAGRLARRLCERSGHYDNVYFACSGSDAVEAALKLARAATRRPRLIALDRAYHGCTFGSVSLMHRGPFTDPFTPLLPGATHLPFGDTDALARELAAGDVAAVVVEPVQGEGGVRPLPDDYVGALCELTKRHDVVLVADEVQTGMGRSGEFLYSARWPRRPDVALLAKQLGGGVAPVSAMLTRRALFTRAYGSDFEDGESHNMTMSYNAVSAVAALASLDLLTDELLARVRASGEHLRASLRRELAGRALYVETRGVGLMCGVSLVQPDHPWVSFEQFGLDHLGGRATIGPMLAYRLYRRGWFTFVCGHDWSILRLQPRLTIEADDLARFATHCREELDALGEIV